LNWPLAYGNSFSLYSTTNLNTTGGWSSIASSIYTNGNQITVTQELDADAKFFRLQKP
jgi:hypothetical protein